MNGKPNKKISCIILTCDSHIHKSNCILHNLCSIFNQDYNNTEVILVENSFNKSTKFLNKIKSKVKDWNNRRTIPYSFKIINNKVSVDMGSARNMGAKIAKGEVLVFMDDDTIVLNTNAFSLVSKLSNKYVCGYGAKRFWTKGKSFDQNSQRILRDLENGKTKILEKIAEFPDPTLREGNTSKVILSNTFITNFGFCLKDRFFEVGPYPSYKGYGFHDDYLMYKLYETRSKLVLLKNISVIHVNHEVYPNPNKNIFDYFDDLVKDGYYWFDVKKIFMNDNTPREKILQKIGSLHYDPVLDEAYDHYKGMYPLDLSSKSNKLSKWRERNRFTREEYARQINLLQNCKNINEYVKQSEADFDNLAPVLFSAILNKFVSINRKGRLSRGKRPNPSAIIDIKTKKSSFRAKNHLNQFPCDRASADRRIAFLRSRYPFSEYLKIAIIGDDDLLSLPAVKELWLRPIVIEKDKEIINIIKDVSTRSEFINHDVRDLINNQRFLKRQKIQTFITDPPYTFNGILTFILAGLEMLNPNADGNEFYVILNKTMVGKSMCKIQKILSESDIYLKEVRKNFSSYKLPSHFSERARANFFLKSQKIDTNALDYSSSSNLYIFWTKNPNTSKIRKMINPKLIYNHYE